MHWIIISGKLFLIHCSLKWISKKALIEDFVLESCASTRAAFWRTEMFGIKHLLPGLRLKNMPVIFISGELISISQPLDQWHFVCVISCFSCVRLFVTLWTVACQALQSKLFSPWDSPGKNTRVDCHVFLQGIFLTQGLNPNLLCLLH